MKYPTSTIGVFCIALIVSFFSGCSKSESPETKSPITLRIHAWEGYAKEHEEFFKQHVRDTINREVNLVITSTTGFESFVEAIEKNGAHLVSPANDFLAPLQRRGLIKQIDPGRLKNFNQLNPIIVQTGCTTINGSLYAVPFNFGAYLIAYNKDKVSVPETYAVLWDPAYRKRVTIPDVYDSINIYMTALLLGMPRSDLFNLSDGQLAAIERKLRVLNREQVVEFWKENLNPAHHDKFDVGMDWGIGVLQINEKYGGNWGVVIPREGATAWVDTWAVTKNVADKETEEMAYAYIDFMISASSQARMAKITSYGPVNPYATRYLNASEKKKFYLTDPKFFGQFILWQPLTESVMKRYKDTWWRSRK